MTPTTLSIIQLVLTLVSALIAAWAHYRISGVTPTAPVVPPTTPVVLPPAPQIGDGHILAALLKVLSMIPGLPGLPALGIPGTPVTPTSPVTIDWAPIILQGLQALLAAQQPPPAAPPK